MFLRRMHVPCAVLSAGLAAGCAPPTVDADLPLDAPPDARAAMNADGAARTAATTIRGLIEGTEGGPVRIELAPGHYWLDARPYTDPGCGNCEDPTETVEATVGLVVWGREVEIVGAGATPADVVIHTGAGYGILFDDCEACALRRVTVTDGARDPDGRATDAAVMIRNGTVEVADVVIRDNLGDSTDVAATVAGIIGVAVREGGDLTLTNSRIIRNSWDGVALYRGARGTIMNNVIDGVDRATGARVGGGRGVGIGLTWDAKATVEGNLVTRYWKGIGVFVDAEGVIRENVVEDVLTWGIVVWDADKGTPRAVLERNLIFGTGACGMNIHDTGDADPSPGRASGNVVTRTGENPRYDSGEPYCEQTAIARPHVPPGFVVQGNTLYRNREAGGQPGRDDAEATAARAAAEPTLALLAARPALSASRGLAVRAAGDPDLVALRSLAPSIRQDMRYAGSENFVGERIDGYDAPSCLLSRPAALALAGVQARLEAEGLSLLVHDCYRPQRAVDHFVRWAADTADRRTKAAYYPNVEKSRLFDEGYIAERSGHSRASTVDLTLVRAGADGAVEPIDMGTPYDFFDPRSHTESPDASAGQLASRLRLRAAMEAGGFRNYEAEWWHYTLEGEPYPEDYLDVVVR